MEREDTARPEATKYPYCRADGATLVTVARTGSGKGKDVWREPKGVKRPQGGYPLYRLPSLLANGDKPLLVVEGEKAAEAAHHLFGDRYEATTSIGGVEKGPHSDWTPARGRQIVIWPDADGKGRDHGAEVAGLCHAAGAAGVRMVETAQLPDGWDLADRAPDGFDIEQAVPILFRVPLPIGRNRVRTVGGAWVTMAELLEGGDDIDSWVVDDMLPSGGLSMLSAKPKAGKSTMARCLALAIARGEPWLGRAVVGGAVLYLALEEKRSAVRAHFQAMGATADDNVVSRFGPAPDEALDALAVEVESLRPQLVILDPLFVLSPSGTATTTPRSRVQWEPLLTLARETGAHVLAVHHARKAGGESGDDVLGSSALFGP